MAPSVEFSVDAPFIHLGLKNIWGKGDTLVAAESCVYFFLAYLFLLERCTGMGPICCFVGVFWFVCLFFGGGGFIFCGEGGFKSLLGWSFFSKLNVEAVFAMLGSFYN